VPSTNLLSFFGECTSTAAASAAAQQKAESTSRKQKARTSFVDLEESLARSRVKGATLKGHRDAYPYPQS